MKLSIIFFLLLIGCSNPYQDLHDSLDETLEIIDTLYPEKPDQDRLRQGMIYGLIQGIDAHGSYLNEMQIKSLREAVEGGELKLGMILTKHKDGLLVKKVFEKSASYAAGIKADDILTQFDKSSLKNIELNDFLNFIKEKKTYDIVLLRNRQKLTKEIIPGHFTPPTAELKWFGNVACLKFGCVSKEAADEIRNYIQKIKTNKKLSGLILDLRDCPGGSFEAGIGIASQFLDGHLVVEMQKKDVFSKFCSSGPDSLNKLSMIILQNKNTCSAAEIIAAALKANKRATLIGQNTAGSATAKEMVSFPNRKDGVIISIAFLNDPLGKRIGHEGVEPDMRIKEIVASKNKDLYIEKALSIFRTK